MGFEQIEVELQGHLGSDRSIAETAWVSSYNKATRAKKTDFEVESLVRQLARDGHGTPFESVVFRFWFRWPLFTDRQHMTHRTMSHNGLSGRYRTMPREYYDIPDDVYDILNKAQSRDTEDRWQRALGHRSSPPTLELMEMYYNSCEMAYHNYQSGIRFMKEAVKDSLISEEEYKRTREFWRGQLPVGGLTERVTTMNLRSFANYQRLRNSEHAQPEIRYAAQRMLEAVKAANICPVAIEELESLGWRI